MTHYAWHITNSFDAVWWDDVMISSFMTRAYCFHYCCLFDAKICQIFAAIMPHFTNTPVAAMTRWSRGVIVPQISRRELGQLRLFAGGRLFYYAMMMNTRRHSSIFDDYLWCAVYYFACYHAIDRRCRLFMLRHYTLLFQSLPYHWSLFIICIDKQHYYCQHYLSLAIHSSLFRLFIPYYYHYSLSLLLWFFSPLNILLTPTLFIPDIFSIFICLSISRWAIFLFWSLIIIIIFHSLPHFHWHCHHCIDDNVTLPLLRAFNAITWGASLLTSLDQYQYYYYISLFISILPFSINIIFITFHWYHTITNFPTLLLPLLLPSTNWHYSFIDCSHNFHYYIIITIDIITYYSI